jgi:HEAT repeat protein
MFRQWLLLAALASGVVITVAVWLTAPEDMVVDKQQADDTPLHLQWHPGVAQRYRVLSESSVQVEAASSSNPPIDVKLYCLLDALTLEANVDDILVGMQLSEVDLQINHQSDTETNRALATPFRVRFAANGMPASFEFPAKVSVRNRSILENLVRMFQLSLEDTDSWLAQETNASGTYEASYRRASATEFEKSKVRLITIPDDKVRWTHISSTETVRLRAGRDWIASMSVDESMRSENKGAPTMMVKNHATLELQPDVQLAVAPGNWNFKAETAAIDDTKGISQPIPDVSKEEARKQILSTIPELDAATSGRLALVHRLRDLLRVDASLPATILEVLKSQQLDERTRADLYLALKLAGTDSAQSALVEVIIDNNWPVEDGMRAIVALGGVSTPTSESISALWNTSQEYSAGADDERLMVASSATFALGRIGSTMNKSDDPEYASLRSNLLSNAMTTTDVNQRANYITALGNTQDPTLAREITVLMDNSEPAIRRATASSLGNLGVDQVADTLVTHYQQESDYRVRSEIARSLDSWTQPTAEAMDMFRQTVQTEKDESARYNIAMLLGKNLEKFPENEAVLREMMRSEPSRRIRQKVAEMLSAQ